MYRFYSNQKPYLLEPNVLVDSPLPIFKSLAQLLRENFGELLTLFLFLLLSLLVYFLRKKKSVETISKKKDTPVDPFVEVLAQLDELANTSPRPAPKPFIFRLSEIIRLYVERQFNLPALECTGEEFIKEVTVHPFLRQKFEEPLKDFVQKGDRIKYSTEQFHGNQLEELLQSARDFVTQANRELESQKLVQQEKLTPLPEPSQK
ncbi:MAG: hypothetical protein VW576_00355 [Opitutae bacterium]